MPSLTRRDWETALFAWEGGACNSFALIRSLAEVMPRIREDAPGTDAFNNHPIMRLYLSQLAFLAGVGIGDCKNADSQARNVIAIDAATSEVRK